MIGSDTGLGGPRRKSIAMNPATGRAAAGASPFAPQSGSFSPFLGGSGGGRSGGGSQPSAPNYSSFGTIRPPKYIDEGLTDRVANNQLAYGDASADLGNLKKEFISPGRSMGKGEDYRARVASAAIQQNSRADAAGTRMNDWAQNSKMRTDYEYAREMEGQRLSGLQHALGQAQWADQFSMQQDAARRLAAQQQAQIQVLGPLYDLYLSQIG